MRAFSPRRILAVARKESLHVIRDARSLGMAIGLPVMMLLLFGYALTLDVDKAPMAIWDQSETSVSRELISRFEGSRYFSTCERALNYRELENAIDTGRALMALIIPRDFASRIGSGRTASVQLIVDGSDSNTATIAMGYAFVAVQNYSQDVVLNENRRIGGRTVVPPLELRPRVWFNADMESRNFIIPGLIAVIMMVSAALLTALTVAREWERGTMEQLISTPVKGPELICGKLLPYLAIGLLDLALTVLMGKFLFHVPMRGSGLLLVAVSFIFLMGTLSMGMLISIMARNQLLASQMTLMTTFLPAFLLSGFMFAISNMPAALQVVTYAVPARYFVTLLKGIYLKGIGLEILGADAALLGVFGVVMFVLANVKFKKKLS